MGQSTTLLKLISETIAVNLTREHDGAGKSNNNHARANNNNRCSVALSSIIIAS
jgi:hypothetical protein